MIEPKSIVLGRDCSDNVFVDEGGINLEAFREETDGSTRVCETREGDPTILPGLPDV